MASFYPLIRPALRRLPREAAHELTLRALEVGSRGFLRSSAAEQSDPPVLAQRLWGLDFTNPVGLAAGYDKDARVPDAMRRLGFGFVEGKLLPPASASIPASATSWGSNASKKARARAIPPNSCEECTEVVPGKIGPDERPCTFPSSVTGRIVGDNRPMFE